MVIMTACHAVDGGSIPLACSKRINRTNTTCISVFILKIGSHYWIF